MAAAAGKWGDLVPRIVSGAVLAVVGLAAIALGGNWFQALAALSCGLMVWELARMVAPETTFEAVALGAMAFVAVGLAHWLGAWALIPALAPAVGAWVWAPRLRPVFAGYALLICVAGQGLVTFRDGHGALWLSWLVLVVIVTDIAGYFAGRALGGPKFWPAISPRKTWSGTVAGWLSAAVVGAVFLLFTNAGRDIVWISALVSLASQMGDIAESAIKRRCGVKDSSNLIPGHGGLLDRFDGLLGASLAMLVVALIVDIPGLRP